MTIPRTTLSIRHHRHPQELHSTPLHSTPLHSTPLHGNVFCNRPSGTFENAILTGDVICCYMAYINPSPLILHSTTATQVSVLKKDIEIGYFYFLLKLIHHLFLIERALYTAQPNPIRSPRHMQKLLVHHRPDRLGKLQEVSLAEREIWLSPDTARSAQTQESPLLTRHAVRKHRKSVPHFDTALPQFKSEKASNVMPGIDK